MIEFLIKYFPGVGEMVNVHPLFVHFPVAFFTAFIVAEFLSLVTGKSEPRVVAKWMLYLGTLGAFAAVVAGLMAAEDVFHEGEIHETMSRHRDFGMNVLALGTILSVWRIIRGRDFSGLGRVVQNCLGILIFVNLVWGTDLGGLMVYKYGVAVDAVARVDFLDKSHEHGGMTGEVMDWFNGLVEHEEPIRKHSH